MLKINSPEKANVPRRLNLTKFLQVFLALLPGLVNPNESKAESLTTNNRPILEDIAGEWPVIHATPNEREFQNAQIARRLEPFFSKVTEYPNMDYEKYIQFVNQPKNKAGDPFKQIDGLDIYFLVWNFFHEARGERSEESKLLSILSVVDRYLDKNFPGTIPGVILANGAYAWVNENKFPSLNVEFGFPGRKTIKPKSADDLKDPRSMRELHECSKFIWNLVVDQNDPGGDKTIDIISLREKIASLLKKRIGFPIPESLPQYHRHSMLGEPKFRQNANIATILRVMVLNKMYADKEPEVFLYGDQLYYPFEYATLDFLTTKYREYSRLYPKEFDPKFLENFVKNKK